MEGQSRQHPQSKKDEGGGDQEGPAFTCQFMKPCECWGSTSRPTHICLHMRIADAYQVICLVQSIGGHGRWFDVVGASGGGGRTDGRQESTTTKKAAISAAKAILIFSSLRPGRRRSRWEEGRIVGATATGSHLGAISSFLPRQRSLSRFAHDGPSCTGRLTIHRMRAAPRRPGGRAHILLQVVRHVVNIRQQNTDRFILLFHNL